MPMRLSGLMSGMDTESVIQQLVAVRQTKVDDAKKAQTKLQWKQDAWKTLNSKILKLYNGVLGTSMRFQGSYMKKVTKVSNSSVVSVITGDGAMNSVQSLKVKKMAQPGYLTGAQLGDGKQGYTTDTRLRDIQGLSFSSSGKFTVTVGGEEKEIEVNGNTTIGQLVESFRNAGINASFDATNQRFYLASKDTGVENDFSLKAADDGGFAMLQKLGLVAPTYYDDTLNDLNAQKKAVEDQKNAMFDLLKRTYPGAFNEFFSGGNVDIEGIKNKIAADTEGKYPKLTTWAEDWDALDARDSELEEQIKVVQEKKDDLAKLGAEGLFATKSAAADAVIELNGVEYTSAKNTFEINGLTLTVNSTTGENETVTLTTQDDTDGIYDMIKSFIKEYSELINEMDKLYNAESSKGYEPLTSEEKDAMSDTEIEEWETKIKESLLRKDSTLGTVSTALKQIMMSGISVNGKTMYLSDFGIETLSYFTAAENEKNAYHIDGDPDDVNTASNTDKLRAMIANDPQTVIDFFVGLSRNMYTELTDRMARTEYSSSYTIYEDVRMQKEYDDYTSKIKDLEAKLADYEDKWYQKFAKMETALSKLQSNASAVTSLLGG